MSELEGMEKRLQALTAYLDVTRRNIQRLQEQAAAAEREVSRISNALTVVREYSKFPPANLEFADDLVDPLQVGLDELECEAILGMSQTEIAAKFIRLSGRPLSPADIAELMIQKGYQAKSRESLRNSMYSALWRRTDLFRRNEDGTWSLLPTNSNVTQHASSGTTSSSLISSTTVPPATDATCTGTSTITASITPVQGAVAESMRRSLRDALMGVGRRVRQQEPSDDVPPTTQPPCPGEDWFTNIDNV